MSVKVFTLRLSEAQLQYVAERADQEGVTKNEFIRKLIDDDIRGDKIMRLQQQFIDEMRNVWLTTGKRGK